MKAWKRYDWKGRLLTLKELSDLSGIPETTLRRRLSHLGWSVERAMRTPVRPQAKAEPRW